MRLQSWIAKNGEMRSRGHSIPYDTETKGFFVVGTCNLTQPCKSYVQGLCENKDSIFYQQDQVFPHDTCKQWEPRE